MFKAYTRYFDFQGRSGRSEFWLFMLFTFLVGVGVSIIDAIGRGSAGNAVITAPIMLLYLLFVLGSFIPSLAVSFRRLHDTGRSAWWLLISLIPLIGFIVLVVFYCQRSAPGANRFGPEPQMAPDDLTETFA